MGGEVERVRREDCSEIKRGPHFSPWKILVGPSDWENHSSGVCGAEKYRTQNLPLGGMGAGFYELGIALTPSKEGHRVRDLNPGNVIPVYIGIADDVRTRLQEYGRNGSHLDGGKSIDLPQENKGLGLFKEVFSRGFSIVFRWVPTKSKKEAEETEARMLKRFDYPWNRGGNGARRPHDIIPMLDKNKIISRKTRTCDALTKCRASTPQVNGAIPSEDSEAGPSHLKFLLGLQATMISRSRPQLVSRRFAVYGQFICGVIMDSGLSCTNIPIEGNKRCIDHKGQRVHGSFFKFVGEASIPSVCGMILEDGSTCKSSPVPGRKRCELHKGKRIPASARPSIEIKTTSKYPSTDFSLPFVKSYPLPSQPISWNHAADDNRCGVDLGDGRFCTRSPVQGRKRCEEHKWKKVTTNVSSQLVSCNHAGDGRFRTRLPVQGSKRCEEHQGRRVSTIVSFETKTSGGGHRDWEFCASKSLRQSKPWTHSVDPVYEENDDICGVSIGNGYCRNRPPSGRKRCDAHKGQRLYGSYSSCVMADYGGFSGVCGATMRNGSTCMSSPTPGNKRCGRHKGMRA